jgi:tetratricopeptide (TPR) repeat protein/anti-sigma regulatory factor (Ser/Thr protein kinase)
MLYLATGLMIKIHAMKNLLRTGLLFLFLASCLPSFSQINGLKAIDSMKNLVPKIKVDTEAVRIIYRIADRYTNINPDSSFYYAKKGLIMANRAGWKRGQGALLSLMGGLKSNFSDFKLALAYHQRSYAINKEIGLKRMMAANLNDIGVVYERQGESTKAQQYHFKALELAIAVKDSVRIPLYYSNIGNIFTEQFDYQKSASYFNKALAIYEALGDYNGIGKIYGNLASVYLATNQLERAALYYRHAVAIYTQTGNMVGAAEILGNLSLLYQDNLDKKLELLFKAKKIYDELDPEQSLSITTLGNIGGTYADIYINKLLPKAPAKFIPATYDQVSKGAEFYLNKAISICKKAGDRINLSYYADNLAQLQETKGDFKQALSNFRLSQKLTDTLFSQENKNKIAHLEAKFNFQKKEDDYQQQQIRNSFRQKQFLLYGILTLVIIVAIVAFVLSRMRIKQLKLKNELQRRLAEERTKELVHQHNLSESELKAIRSQMNPHFIFNVLNSIESYILESDPRTASRLVQKFATLSRLILENSTQRMVTVEREWKALKLYTELEAMRFNYQFTYQFNVDPDLDLTQLLVPPMLVQPMIENAILHGLRNADTVGSYVKVSLTQDEATISFTVEDNGIGLEEAKKLTSTSTIKSQSIGLSAIRERINIINTLSKGEHAEFHIESTSVDGRNVTMAVLRLPKG